MGLRRVPEGEPAARRLGGRRHGRAASGGKRHGGDDDQRPDAFRYALSICGTELNGHPRITGDIGALLWITRETTARSHYGSVMPHDHMSEDMYVDANGCPTEVVALGGQVVAVHYDDIPESDITTVGGLRCTTPLRTVIDIAPETSESELKRIVRDCLDRGLFTTEEALTRLAQPDIASRRGAELVRRTLPDEGRSEPK
jgi:hypothetical protein